MRGARGRERPAHVGSALGEAQAPLPGAPARAGEQCEDGDVPVRAELARESLRRVVAAVSTALRIGRDEDQRLAAVVERVGGQGSRDGRQAAEASLLPASDESAHGLVVGDSRPRPGEGQPPAGALAAASDGPGRGGAAALAARAAKSGQRAEAALADLRTRKPARNAALRQQEVEQARSHEPTVRAAGVTRVRWGAIVTLPRPSDTVPSQSRPRGGDIVSAVGGGKRPHPI